MEQSPKNTQNVEGRADEKGRWYEDLSFGEAKGQMQVRYKCTNVECTFEYIWRGREIWPGATVSEPLE